MSVTIVKQNIACFATHLPQMLLQKLQDWDGLIWLADDTQPVIGLCPRWQISHSNGQVLFKQRGLDGRLLSTTPPAACFEQVVQTLWTADQLDQWQLPQLEGFCGGLLGFLGYDWSAARHGVALSNAVVTHPSACQALLGCYDVFLRWDTQSGWQVYGNRCPSLDAIYAEIAACIARPLSKTAAKALKPFQSRWSLSEYEQAFARVQDYLKAGDCYQINLTQAFDTTVDDGTDHCLLHHLDSLLQLTRAPYAGYLAVNQSYELLSCSPELFLSFLPDGEVVTRPIKGTQPRHADPIQDAALRQQLALSEKDQAENLMIVDLLRNDLARQAKIGSVRVPKLFEIESFAQVHHLVSEVRATLSEQQSALDLLFDALPGGSITGAPKIRAMQIIAELEAGQRGAYCGSMGYLNANATGRFNILIRSLERTEQQISVWAGGGITIASDVAAEYQECLDKVGAILHCLAHTHHESG